MHRIAVDDKLPKMRFQKEDVMTNLPAGKIGELKNGTGISKIEPKRRPVKYGKKPGRRTARA